MNDQELLFNLFDKLRNEKCKFGVSSCALITGDADSGMHSIVERYTSNLLMADESQMKIFVFQYKLHRVFINEDETSGTKNRMLTAKTVLGNAVIDLVKTIDQDNSNGCHPGLAGTEGPLAEKHQMFVQLTKSLGMELIIFNFDVDEKKLSNPTILSSLADMFKDLIDDTQIPIVLIGAPWIGRLLESNPQLDVRVIHRVNLSQQDELVN